MSNIDIEGEIRRGDARKLEKAISLLSDTFIVSLNSPGGDIDEAMRMGRMLSEKTTWTSINRGDVCASSCILIYAGGIK
jgi:hypothetical protein